MSLNHLKATIRRWLGCSVDGELLLQEARLTSVDGTTALVFERELTHPEMMAIREAWVKRPPTYLDPGA